MRLSASGPTIHSTSCASAASRFAVSASSRCATVVMLSTVGLNFGVDFLGGTLIGSPSRPEADMGDIRADAERARLRRGRGAGIRHCRRGDLDARRHPAGGEAAQQSPWCRRRAMRTFGDGYEFRRVEPVGPQVSGELVDRHHRRRALASSRSWSISGSASSGSSRSARSSARCTTSC